MNKKFLFRRNLKIIELFTVLSFILFHFHISYHIYKISLSLNAISDRKNEKGLI